MMRQDRFTQQAPPCHPERSEGSPRNEMLRGACPERGRRAQHDRQPWGEKPRAAANVGANL